MLLQATINITKAACTAQGLQRHRNVALSEFVNGLVPKLGANPNDLVPFEKYAAAAHPWFVGFGLRALNKGGISGPVCWCS
jgi:hypothetical protein